MIAFRAAEPHAPVAADIDRLLAVCEGSDWFWWFGDYNPADSVRDFDQLFRRQLDALYLMGGRRAAGAPAGAAVDGRRRRRRIGGSMRRGGRN